MKFVCDRCQTKYSIADERVRGKVLKVKCKSCANVITVREARRPSAASPSLSAAPVARGRTGPAAALSVPAEAPEIDSERTQLAMSPFGADPLADAFPDLLTPAAPSGAVRRPTGALAAVDADDGVQWYMALDGNRTGPFSRTKLVDKLVPLAKNADVHIWNEKLDGWKPPSNVAEVAAEIARRRAPAPPPPPPLPSARRPTPPPAPPLAGLSGLPHGQPARKPTGPHAPPSPVATSPGAGGSKLPPPGGIHPALAARGAEHVGPDAASLLETPMPMALPHAAPKTNGANGHAPPKPVNSDVMQMLNLPGGTQTVPGAPPRLMSVTSTVGWTASAEATKGRSKSTLLILALLGVIGLIVVVAVISLKKPPKPAPVAVKPTPVETAPVAAKPPEPPPPPPIAPEPPPPEPPQKGKGKLKGKQARVAASKQAQNTAQTPTTPTPPPPTPGGDAARFRDNHTMDIKGGGAPKLPPPDQSAITRVISNNRAGIKVCYQRALTRDNSLTHGKLSVKLSIGISGRVKHMTLDGPTQFRLLLEPCIKEVVQRWVFPQASEEYGTEFPLVFQGNE
jgi:predicted Zn finger-like uncharacterized protein